MANTSHADGTVISVSPLYTEVQESDINKTFDITINITNSPPVIQWMLRVSWNPAVLQLKGNPKEGTFLSNVGSTTFLYKNINNTLGRIGEMTCIIMTAGQSASGNGDLVYLTFNATAPGESGIIIYESALVTATTPPANATYTVTPGQVIVIPEFPASMILPLFIILTAAIVITIKILRPKRLREYINP
jgi:hypothetical protein